MLAGGVDVFQVLFLLLVELAEHALVQHPREADDGVPRSPQLPSAVPGPRSARVAARHRELQMRRRPWYPLGEHRRRGRTWRAPDSLSGTGDNKADSPKRHRRPFQTWARISDAMPVP